MRHAKPRNAKRRTNASNKKNGEPRIPRSFLARKNRLLRDRDKLDHWLYELFTHFFACFDLTSVEAYGSQLQFVFFLPATTTGLSFDR